MSNTSSMEGDGDDEEKTVMKIGKSRVNAGSQGNFQGSDQENSQESQIQQILQNPQHPQISEEKIEVSQAKGFFYRVKTSVSNLKKVMLEILNAAHFGRYELLLTGFPSSSNKEFYNAVRSLYESLLNGIIVSRAGSFNEKENGIGVVGRLFTDEGCRNRIHMKSEEAIKCLFAKLAEELGPIKYDKIEFRFRNGRLHVSILGYTPRDESQLFHYSKDSQIEDKGCCVAVVYPHESDSDNPFILSPNSLEDNIEANLELVR